MSKKKRPGFYYALRLKNAFVYEVFGDGTPVLHASKREAEDWRSACVEPKDWVAVKVKLVEVKK